MNYRVSRYIAVALLCLFPVACSAQQTQDLSGRWRFQIDRKDVGIKQQWFKRDLAERIKLPGSLQEHGFGNDPSAKSSWTGSIKRGKWNEPRYAAYKTADNFKMPFWLQPDKVYVGPAWYQRQITIPKEWKEKRITLNLERSHWTTTVWVDDAKVGSADSLSVPHVYDLTKQITPGEHRLTIRVDNRMHVNVGNNAHSVSDNTQTNWNGLIGRLELCAVDPIRIDNVRIYPDVANQSAKVEVAIANATGFTASGILRAQAQTYNTAPQESVGEKEVPFEFGSDGKANVSIDYPMGENVQLWDEFNPALYRMTFDLKAEADGREYSDKHAVTFGMRNLTTKGTQFVLNERPIFLRGTLECCIFPKTGYPATDVDYWKRMIRRCKAYGLNHMRFHSWCPPEAAFKAADELGFYFQVEGPFWTSVGKEKPIDKYIYTETDRILQAYGNHPSFLLMAYGNEPGGNHKKYLGKWLEHYKQKDPRRLWTSAAGWPLINSNDYHCTHRGTRIQGWGEGLRSIINSRPPQTRFDWSDFVTKHNDKPTISHETGQWCVYPNFDEIKKYTGVLKAKNFEIFRDFLTDAHMAEQARDFLMASGKLQMLCYKADIEATLRTKGFGGFQLLQLHDFPGQGTALVGVLDPFWDPKPYVSAEQFLRFCNATVPLIRLPKRTYTTDEMLKAQVELSHFGPADLKDALVQWTLSDDNKHIVAQGKFPSRRITTGQLTTIGKLEFTLEKFRAPAQLNLEVCVKDTDIANDWDVWVYPSKAETKAPEGVHIARMLDADTVEVLKKGGKVVLLAEPGNVKTDVALGFSSIFWNTAWTRGQPPHTLGILCDPKHPAFAHFPTKYHSDWQWWELVHDATTMEMDSLPPELRPIVQVVPDWFEPKRLGLAFEANVAGGKLLVCSMDLQNKLGERPVACQMRHSLLHYAAGEEFDPKHELTVEQARGLLKSPPLIQKLNAIASADSAANNHEPPKAIDGDTKSIWHTPWEPTPVPMPHYLTVDLGKPVKMGGITALPRQDMSNGRIARYEIHLSKDGKNWGKAVSSGTWSNNAKLKRIVFDKPRKARYIRLTARSEINGNAFASLAELNIIRAE